MKFTVSVSSLVFVLPLLLSQVNASPFVRHTAFSRGLCTDIFHRVGLVQVLSVQVLSARVVTLRLRPVLLPPLPLQPLPLLVPVPLRPPPPPPLRLPELLQLLPLPPPLLPHRRTPAMCRPP